MTEKGKNAARSSGLRSASQRTPKHQGKYRRTHKQTVKTAIALVPSIQQSSPVKDMKQTRRWFCRGELKENSTRRHEPTDGEPQTLKRPKQLVHDLLHTL